MGRTLDEARQRAVEALQAEASEDALWAAVAAFQGFPFRTSSGLPFRYTLKTGRNGEWTRELWIDRRENSKSLAWSSVRLAFQQAVSMAGQVVAGPKSLGNIRGVSYIYPMLWRFGVIVVPEKIAEKMQGPEANEAPGAAGSKRMENL